jgi:formate-dependent nitrite reductase membrane component NrfD
MAAMADEVFKVKPGALTVGVLFFIALPILLVALATSGESGGAISSVEEQLIRGSGVFYQLQLLCLFASPVFLVILPQWLQMIRKDGSDALPWLAGFAAVLTGTYSGLRRGDRGGGRLVGELPA